LQLFTKNLTGQSEPFRPTFDTGAARRRRGLFQAASILLGPAAQASSFS
jgi:hypothetical protein